MWAGCSNRAGTATPGGIRLVGWFCSSIDAWERFPVPDNLKHHHGTSVAGCNMMSIALPPGRHSLITVQHGITGNHIRRAATRVIGDSWSPDSRWLGSPL